MTPAQAPKPGRPAGPGQPAQPVDGVEPPSAPGFASPLAQALIEALPRLCAGERLGGRPTDPSLTDPTLVDLIGALAAALEQGELELALGGPAPDGIDPQGWPERQRLALAATPLAVRASELERRPEAPLVWSEGRLRWRRWPTAASTSRWTPTPAPAPAPGTPCCAAPAPPWRRPSR